MKLSNKGRSLSLFSGFEVAEVNLCSLNSTLNADLDSGQHEESSLLLQGNGSDMSNSHPFVDSLERRSKAVVTASTKVDADSASATKSLDTDGRKASGYLRMQSSRAGCLNMFLDSLPWIVALVWMLLLWINGH